MKLSRFLLLLFIPLYFFSCKPQQILPQYLDDFKDTVQPGTVSVPELLIQKYDMVSIHCMSLSTKPQISDSIFNQPAPYLVDANGNIEHHRLGSIHVEGLNKRQLADEIKRRLTVPAELLSNPTVVVSIVNFKVTVLGQVAKEGLLNVPGERLTIFEAIGLAGGITDFGKKTDLKILREINGKRETGYINLSSKDVFNSPFYYLMQNDVVFVGSTSQKGKDAEQLKTMQKISFALALATAAASITQIFIRN